MYPGSLLEEAAVMLQHPAPQKKEKDKSKKKRSKRSKEEVASGSSSLSASFISSSANNGATADLVLPTFSFAGPSMTPPSMTPRQMTPRDQSQMTPRTTPFMSPRQMTPRTSPRDKNLTKEEARRSEEPRLEQVVEDAAQFHDLPSPTEFEPVTTPREAEKQKKDAEEAEEEEKTKSSAERRLSFTGSRKSTAGAGLKGWAHVCSNVLKVASTKNILAGLKTILNEHARQTAAFAEATRHQAERLIENDSFRATAVGAGAGAATLGVGGGVTGLATGSAIGAAVGILPAFFTFGLSIPIGAAMGGGTGLFVGAAAGGTAGAVGGGAAGYGIHSRKEDIEKATDYVKGKAASVRARFVGGA
eukprot:TRINITY_DN6121_c1_g1_i1.p1 TRINITY_DN6121_c1_g1~~TRINITY_DN6121_c1_g1_i1.p1  ORF type:complete len:360 (-),score=90.62 TRINITY_DN6121_c1_g1_i1:301-1380(-)